MLRNLLRRLHRLWKLSDIIAVDTTPGNTSVEVKNYPDSYRIPMKSKKAVIVELTDPIEEIVNENRTV